MYKVLLAIDFGTVRIGLAVSRGTLAEPLKVVPNDAEKFSNILAVIKNEHVDKIIVGLSENVMAEKTKSFAEELRQYTSLPIVFTDETLSSKTVHQKLMSAKKSKRSGAIDHYAAAEFLQEYIDTL